MVRFEYPQRTFPTAYCVRMYRSVKGKLAKSIWFLFSSEVNFHSEKAIMLTVLEKIGVEFIQPNTLAISFFINKIKNEN